MKITKRKSGEFTIETESRKELSRPHQPIVYVQIRHPCTSLPLARIEKRACFGVAVNWAIFGSSSLQDAETMMKAMRLAVRIAKKLESTTEG